MKNRKCFVYQQIEATAHRLHIAAAPRAREAIQGQQVLVAAKAIRGSYGSDAKRDSGKYLLT
jgi:hypothetical protein